jgi:hypothetical protein
MPPNIFRFSDASLMGIAEAHCIGFDNADASSSSDPPHQGKGS